MKILLVEDDLINVMIVKRASGELEIKHKITHVKNGQEAIDYLLNPDNECPDLILLDLNMPIMNGMEFLEFKSNHKEIAMIPTVVLTTSNTQQDITRCCKMNISGYMVKALDYNQFKKELGIIINYWSISTAPVYC